MNRSMSELAQRNQLSIERLRAEEMYINQMRNLERILDEFRFNLSKTKSVMGFALAQTGMVNTRELDASERVSIKCDNGKNVFCLEEGSANVSESTNGLRQRVSNKDKEAEGDSRRRNSSTDSEKPTPTVFRPFGLLEPNNAKLARQNMKSALPLVCELASLQQELRRLNSLNEDLSSIEGGKKGKVNRHS